MDFYKILFLALSLSLGACTGQVSEPSESPNNNKPSSPSPNTAKEDAPNWRGQWQAEAEQVAYVLAIKFQDDKIAFPCQFTATGRQTFYDLQCRCEIKDKKVLVYYQAVLDGAFFTEQIDLSQAILALNWVSDKRAKGDWLQLYEPQAETDRYFSRN